MEGAVLVSRLHMPLREKIDTEMRYLQIAIDEAWGWLMEVAGNFHAGASGPRRARRSATGRWRKVTPSWPRCGRWARAAWTW